MPTATVSATVGGLAFMSMTNSLLSGAIFQALPSWFITTELATRPSLPSGVTCRFVGGPSREFISGSEARMRGLAGSATLMISTASLPGGPFTWPLAS